MSDDNSGKPNQKTILGHAPARQPTASEPPADPRDSRMAKTVAGRVGAADIAQRAKNESGGTQQGYASARSTGATEPPVDEDYCGYKLLEKIAEGGMGVVYRGEHKTLGRIGAIKVLKPEYCQNEEIVSRFRQEARAANVIGHENIVEIFDFGRTSDGRVFFVMEYLDGEPLSARLARGAMSWNEARPLLEQTLRALSAAHNAGLVHRDLKPDNIYLRRKSDGSVEVRLLDFGIAKLSGMDSPSEQLTKTGALIGTPHYMSPEQIDGAANVDARTDIYSLGIILFEMFSGVLPFSGDTLGAVIKQHLLEPPPPVNIAAADVPDAISVVIRRMLAKEPERRYQSIVDVASDLADVAFDKPPSHAGDLEARFPTQMGAAPAPAQMPAAHRVARTEPPPVPKAGSNRILLFATAFVVAAAAGLAIYYFTTRDKGEKTAAKTPDPKTVTDAGATKAPPVPAIDKAKLTTDARSLLQSSLVETEPSLRAAGVSGLAAVGDNDSGPEIAKLVSGDPDQTVRGHAADAIARLGFAAGSELIDDQYKAAAPGLRVWFDEALVRLEDDRKARRRLTKATGDSDLGVSFKASLALADLSPPGDRKAIKSLTKMAAREAELKDVAPYAGLVILTKLAKQGDDTAHKALLDALELPDEAARLAAAEGLARIGDESGKDALLKILADTASPNRGVAARALILLGDYSGFDVLTGNVASKEAKARSHAARGLGEIGEQSSLGTLAPLLADGDKPVRIAAAVAILTIVGLDPTVLSQASIDWAKTALASQDWATRLAAARTIGDFESDAAMPLFARAVIDERPEVRKTAAQSARRLTGKEPARVLAAAAAAETDDDVQEAQVRTLAVLKQPVAKAALTEIASGKGRVAVLASGALVAIGEVDAVTQIDEAMKSSRSSIRLAAVESAGIANDNVVIPTLLTGLRDKLFKIQFVAAEMLARYKAEKDQAVAVLRKGLTGKGDDVGARAVAALLAFGVRPDAGPTPTEMLESPDPKLRRAGVLATAFLGWPSAGPLLRRASRDRDTEVRHTALDVLAKFIAANRDGVTRLYRELARSSDRVVRTRAQARLAQLAGPAKTTQTAPKPNPAGDIEELRAAREAVMAARAQLEKDQADLEKVVKEIDEATASPAKNEDDVDRVEKLARDVEAKASAVKKSRQTLQSAATKSNSAGRGLDTDEAKKLREEIRGAARVGGDAVRAAISAGRKARRKAKKYAQEETADPEIYLTSAKTAIATGKLRAAKADLRKAEKLFKARGRVDPDVYFAYGELYSKLATSATSDKSKLRNLKRAVTNFDRFSSRGSGFRVGQAKARSAEATAMIKELEAK